VPNGQIEPAEPRPSETNASALGGCKQNSLHRYRASSEGAFRQSALLDGLHAPAARPTADEWEQALIKTVDLRRSGKLGIPAGSSVDITDGNKILLSGKEGGRLAVVQLANN